MLSMCSFLIDDLVDNDVYMTYIVLHAMYHLLFVEFLVLFFYLHVKFNYIPFKYMYAQELF